MYRKSPYNSWRSVYTGVKSLNRVNLKKPPEGMLQVFKFKATGSRERFFFNRVVVGLNKSLYWFLDF
jgi:hypothetical protein